MNLRNLRFLLLAVSCLLLAGLTAAAQDKCGDGDWDCIVARETQKIQANPSDAEAYYARSIAYKHKQQYSLAVKDLDKYLSFPQENKIYLADGYRERAMSRSKLNDIKGAMADLDKAIQINPDENEAYYTRGQIYENQKDYAGAITDFTKYIQLNAAKPDYLADGYYGRAYAYNATGKYTKAIDDLTKAIDLDDSKAMFFTERAFAYRKLGKADLAAADEARASALKKQ